ncbi:MAG: PadR family transcriptional regulator [Gammaproteobacteria bacterium]|nr:PadR family transcriptional regulator [Gammaproteobacteria bacterium]
MILGLLRSGARHGYELHRIVVAHGSLYADFKKPTLYHLLHRLALHGAVAVRSEGGARGPRGERLVFALTAQGEALLLDLLRGALASHDSPQTNFEVAVAFIGLLPPTEAQDLLRRRRDGVRARRTEVTDEMASISKQGDPVRLAPRLLAADHALSVMDADIAWTDRAIRQLGALARRAVLRRASRVRHHPDSDRSHPREMP